ncbi:hypothetical protein Q5P01_016872 [Channa striata]|uniref:Pentraxin (PTX) domain-containing protein n=1 Tax=Channa striata TaxID=64152 RepID=A0AA88M922_CHASR|nr:hypothetical protein Q5P01_016872 [Channa striata]
MRLFIFVFLTTISTELAGGATIKNLVFPSESDNSYVELVPKKSLILSAFTLCMRVATELQGNREVILFAYRTPNNDELNVWHGVLFKVPELGALETHLCFTWDSSSGASALFMDGRRSLTKIYRQHHTISPGGKVILGQDPDSYLGGFDINQSFVGSITGDMWDYVLSDGTIQDMVFKSRALAGNIFDWDTINLETHGGVHVNNREL